MSKALAIQVEAPDAVSEQSLRSAEVIARQAAVITLQQRGELTIREAAVALELTYEQYLQLLAEKDLGISRFKQDPAALQSPRQNSTSAQTETIQFTISGLPRGTRGILERVGRNLGKTVEEYLRGVIEVELLSQKTFREILAPIRGDFRATGLTEDELDEIIERERQAIWMN